MHKKISSPFSQNYNYLLKTTNKKIIGHSKKEKSKNININQIPFFHQKNLKKFYQNIKSLLIKNLEIISKDKKK